MTATTFVSDLRPLPAGWSAREGRLDEDGNLTTTDHPVIGLAVIHEAAVGPTGELEAWSGFVQLEAAVLDTRGDVWPVSDLEGDRSTVIVVAPGSTPPTEAELLEQLRTRQADDDTAATPAPVLSLTRAHGRP